MPRESVFMIRSALLYLLIAVAAGSVLYLENRLTAVEIGAGSLFVIHVYSAMYGWFLQMVMGAAFWIFPKYLEQPTRGNPYWIRSAIAGLTIGIPMVMAERLGLVPGGAGIWLIVISVLSMIGITTARVISYGNRK